MLKNLKCNICYARVIKHGLTLLQVKSISNNFKMKEQ